MKRLVTLVLVLAMIAGLAWWQRATLAPYLARTIPASAPVLAAIPGVAETLAPKDPAADAAQQGGRRRGGGPVAVTVAQTGLKVLPVTVDAVGSVQAAASIAIRPRIDSQIVSVAVSEGAKVTEGDTLFTLDDRTVKAQIAQTEAQIVKDQAQIQQATLDLGRANDLLSRNAGAQTTRDTAQTTLKVAQAQLAADQASLDATKATLTYTVIRAPVSGRLGSIPVKPGAIVRTADTAPLATINQIDPVMVSFALPQRNLAALRAAMAKGPVPVAVKAGKETAEGAVAFIENAIDTTTGTITVKASVPNAQEVLWPGAYVTATVTLDRGQPAVTVPSAALQLGQDGSYLFSVKDGKTAQLRRVTVERSFGADTVVSQGVDEGETVVVDGQLRLVDGAPLSIKQQDPAQAQAPAAAAEAAPVPVPTKG